MSERKVFVYGTFKRGGKWNHFLEGSEFIAEDKIQGDMYLAESGYYPILYHGIKWIAGEVYIVNDQTYDKMVEMEGDADYTTLEVETISGMLVQAFFFNEESQKKPDRALDTFDAPHFFQHWIETTSVDSASYREFIELGGKIK